MSVATASPIAEREARARADLDAKCVRAWRKSRSLVKAARFLKVSTARVRAAVERGGGGAGAGAERSGSPSPPKAWSFDVPEGKPARPRDEEPPEPAQDLAGDPISADEVRGWIALRKAGWHDADIADEAEVDVFKVAQLCSAVARRDHESGGEPGDGKVRPPRLQPRFPAGPFTPGSKCSHATRPYPKGSLDYCPICDRTGLDGLHPALYRNPKLDPPPEPKAKPEKPDRPMTRAERRKALAEALREHKADARRSDYEARKAKAARAEAARRDANGRSPGRPR
jgi:hypothetical protein